MIEAPPPSPGDFAEAFLVIPGILAGFPLALTGTLLEREWLTQLGLIFGAGCFWYCVGWYVDRSRGVLKNESTPLLVRWYVSASIVTSMILFPLLALMGLRLGVHYCASGAYPYWVEVLSYGILMFWTTLGTYFGWLRWRAKKEQEHPPGVFRI